MVLYSNGVISGLQELLAELGRLGPPEHHPSRTRVLVTVGPIRTRVFCEEATITALELTSHLRRVGFEDSLYPLRVQP